MNFVLCVCVCVFYLFFIFIIVKLLVAEFPPAKFTIARFLITLNYKKKKYSLLEQAFEKCIWAHKNVIKLFSIVRHVTLLD